MNLKKTIIAFIVVSTMIICNINTASADIFYYDVFDHWAADYIYWATNELKIFNGYEDYTFRPDENISRAEFIKILCRTAEIQGLLQIDAEYEKIEQNVDDENNQEYQSNEKELNKVQTFGYSDINGEEWWYRYVVKVGEYINNAKDNYKFQDVLPGRNFAPNKDITREEAAVLSSYFSSPSISNVNKKITDIDEDYKYYNEIRKLVDNGIITGYEDNTFRPKQNITRAESATIIKRLYFDMEYLKGKYLQHIQFINDYEKEKLTLFGNYDYNNLSENDQKYIKAKNTIEYKSFAEYIFPEDKHFYDSEPLKTLRQLKESGYHNIVGINYYLINYGELTQEEKDNLYKELINEYIKRDDISDYESTKIFKESLNYNIEQEKIFEGLEKWYEMTQDDKVKEDIKFIRYKLYIKTNQLDKLLQIVEQEIEQEKIIEQEEKVIKTNEKEVNKQGEEQKVEELNTKQEDNTSNNVDDEKDKENNIIEEEIEQSNSESKDSAQEETNEAHDLNKDANKESTESQVDSEEKQLENKKEDSLSELDVLDIRIKNILNRAYIMKYMKKFDKAEIILREGWDEIKENPLYASVKDVYDKQFIGSIKEVLINKKNFIVEFGKAINTSSDTNNEKNNSN
ncbi:S-layer homology domain-containing protein [Caldisalinibacter kiritimatiensis]|uniref:SLH domain-containing protein n=1 Tax=Caldisalinibacter kiritimatiensis TaxID=1304284 RepID=R1AT16_9FIRM|nr:S-layer homology domain-containing protein [Caldisalinibacter kiritimatiensis]EOC99791.1 hypothetical protein L21TH_2170 [Caldisalinibacter kiritimatiensis]